LANGDKTVLLVNQTAFQNWLEKAALTAQLRSRQISDFSSQISDSQVSSLGEWWDRIKSQAEGSEFQRAGSTAIVNVQGALEYHYSIWSWFYDSDSYKGIAAKVRAAAMDEDIDRIVLNVHSPGGVHHGCPECAQAVFDARSVKEVVAVVDYEAASAGYYIASQATRIVGLTSGWVGSIGTQIMLYSTKRMYEQDGIDIEVIRAAQSPNKNLGIPYEPISDAARQERQGWVDRCAADFVAAVARGRGINDKQVLDKFGQGKMFFMSEAKQLGMVDSFGNLDQVLGEKRKTGNTSNRANSKVESTPSPDSNLHASADSCDASIDQALSRLWL
jgi:signal peptide peptidase SppA